MKRMNEKESFLFSQELGTAGMRWKERTLAVMVAGTSDYIPVVDTEGERKEGRVGEAIKCSELSLRTSALTSHSQCHGLSSITQWK